MKFEKLLLKYPEFKDLSEENLENFVMRNRDLDLCSLCPENVRGTCCFVSAYIQTPNRNLCDICYEKLRVVCKPDYDNLPKKGKVLNIILEKHPCKFLNMKTKLCDVYEDRFWRNRGCQTIKGAITTNCLPSECVYLKGSTKRKYNKKSPKVFYKDVEDQLCLLGKRQYELSNESPHDGLYGIKDY